MGALRPTHMLVLLLIILLLFGARRLPELAKGVGQSLKILRTEVRELQDDDAPGQTSAHGRPAVDGERPVDGERSGGGSPRPAVASSPDAPA